VLLAGATVSPRPSRAAPPGFSPAGSIEDHGVFVVSVNGQPLGTETFDIRSRDDRVEAEAKINLRIEHDGKIEEFKTFPKLILNGSLEPMTYSWSQKGPQSSQLEVDFQSSPAKVHYRTVAGEDDRRDFVLPKDVLVLDVNVVHHYQLAVYRYHQTAGGKQTFQVFVPQEAMPGSLEVEEAGQESVEINAHSETLQHLVVAAELARIDLWVDAQQRLQRVSIPAAQLEAVRKK
jgi:hypothetical protein